MGKGIGGVKVKGGEQRRRRIMEERTRRGERQGRKEKGKTTYVIKSIPMLINLHNLQTRIRPLLHAQLGQLRRAQLRNAKRAVARLVKVVEQADVKGGDFVAETERHVRVRPRVADLEVQGAAGEGPGGTVVGAEFLGDVCACVFVEVRDVFRG